VWASLGLSGRVRCQVGCVTDRPIASSSPCMPACVLARYRKLSGELCGALTFMYSAATQREAHGHAKATYR
jgi:hypothetical protein